MSEAWYKFPDGRGINLDKILTYKFSVKGVDIYLPRDVYFQVRFEVTFDDGVKESFSLGAFGEENRAAADMSKHELLFEKALKLRDRAKDTDSNPGEVKLTFGNS